MSEDTLGRADEIGAPRVVGGQGHDERCGEGERHGARDGRPPGQGGRWSGKTRKRRPQNRSMALRLTIAAASSWPMQAIVSSMALMLTFSSRTATASVHGLAGRRPAGVTGTPMIAGDGHPGMIAGAR